MFVNPDHNLLESVWDETTWDIAAEMISHFSRGPTTRPNKRGQYDEALNNQREFSAEMGIPFPGLKNIDKPVVWVFTELVVCLDCGTTEFAVPEAELRILAKGDTAAAGWPRIGSY
jgi:hypothetical protein